MKKSTLNFYPHELLIIESTKIESIAYTDVVAIYCDKPYLIIQTPKKKYLANHSLSNLIAHLPLFFCQCSKSLIVSLLFVQCIERDSGRLITIGNETIHVSRRRIEGVCQRFIEVRTAKLRNDMCRFCKNKTA